MYWLSRYLDPVTLTYISRSSDFYTFYVYIPLSLGCIIQKVSTEDIAIRGDDTGLEYMCPTRHFVYIFFNPVFQLSTAYLITMFWLWLLWLLPQQVRPRLLQNSCPIISVWKLSVAMATKHKRQTTIILAFFFKSPYPFLPNEGQIPSMDLEELSFEIDGQMKDEQKVITIAHPEQSSGELKKTTKDKHCRCWWDSS